MSNRHKALGRNRGPFAPNTVYLRGDVVNHQGALHSALTFFRSGSAFVASDWEVVLAAPVIPNPTAASLGAALASHKHDALYSVTTTGPGLPMFTGRKNGDQHYDETAKKEYSFTGVVGGNDSDNFERPDGALAGNTVFSSGTTRLWTTGGNIAIRSGQVVSTVTSGSRTDACEFSSIPVAGTDTAPISVTMDVSNVARMGVFVRATAHPTPTISGTSAGYAAFINPYSGGRPVLTIFRSGTIVAGGGAAENSFPETADGYTLTLEVATGGKVTGVVKNRLSGAVLKSITYTDPAPITTGTLIGFGVPNMTSPLAGAHSFSFQSLGTAAWTSTSEYVAAHTHPYADVNHTHDTAGTAEHTHDATLLVSQVVKARLAEFLTDADGYGIITHNFGFTPGAVVGTAVAPIAGTALIPASCIIDSLTATTFRVRVFDQGGVPYPNGQGSTWQFIGYKA